MKKHTKRRKPGVGRLIIQGAREALAQKRGQLRNVRVTRAPVVPDTGKAPHSRVIGGE